MARILIRELVYCFYGFLLVIAAFPAVFHIASPFFFSPQLLALPCIPSSCHRSFLRLPACIVIPAGLKATDKLNKKGFPPDPAGIGPKPLTF